MVHPRIERLLVLGLAYLLLLHSSLSIPVPARAQSSCDSYNHQCTVLQSPSGNMVQGPISYYFDPDFIEGEFLLSHEDAVDLKQRVQTAVAD
jgi:hypothetical protein